LTGELPRCEGIGDEAVIPQILEVPLRRAFRFPAPKEPPCVGFVGIHLRFDVGAQICLVNLAQSSGSANGFSGAVSDVITASASSKGAVISSSGSKTVQPFGTIRLCACPLPNHHPLVCSSKFWVVRTRVCHMLARSPGIFGRAEYLVDVSVEQDIAHTGCRVHKAVPVGINVHESVVDDCESIRGLLVNVPVSIIIELLGRVHVNIATESCWLVKQLDTSHNICVG